MDDIAIKVEGVSKTFKLPHEKQTSLKGAFINKFKGGNRSFERQRALENISFDVKKGEFFGIVGRNGSGKSTLLKMLAGIYSPDEGDIQINGKLTPFIELGVGFNAELTGRENVYLNGALLGFNRKDMRAMYNDIVEFAELRRFMDQKLKNYSSGMQVRLAFSIAIRSQSEILLVDEVLAVGDAAFQKKCLDTFKGIKSSGRTVVFVSHDMSSIREYCDRALLIHEGKEIDIDDPYTIASRYIALNQPIPQDLTIKKGSIISAIILNAKDSFGSGDTVQVKVKFKPQKEKGVIVGLSILKEDTQYIAGFNTKGLELKSEVTCSIPCSQFLVGNYLLSVYLYTKKFELLDYKPAEMQFRILNKSIKQKNKDGTFNLLCDWKTMNN